MIPHELELLKQEIAKLKYEIAQLKRVDVKHRESQSEIVERVDDRVAAFARRDAQLVTALNEVREELRAQTKSIIPAAEGAERAAHRAEGKTDAIQVAANRADTQSFAAKVAANRALIVMIVQSVLLGIWQAVQHILHGQ